MNGAQKKPAGYCGLKTGPLPCLIQLNNEIIHVACFVRRLNFLPFIMVTQIKFKDLNTFTVLTPSLESSLDIISNFIANGRPIYSAILVDSDGSRIKLPLEALDGEQIGHHLKEIELAYQEALVDKVLDMKDTTKRAILLKAKVDTQMGKVDQINKDRIVWRSKVDQLLQKIDVLLHKIRTYR
ncbi:hypothetical protein [Larkinella insperata]|nr:hypothetical protein [Larkinella insperata]